jgi:hypothetical protein
LVAFFDPLLGAIKTINANGIETVDSFLGTSLVVALYDNSGNFLSATLFGISLPSWVWNLQGLAASRRQALAYGSQLKGNHALYDCRSESEAYAIGAASRAHCLSVMLGR